jgi:hypothetical protein
MNNKEKNKKIIESRRAEEIRTYTVKKGGKNEDDVFREQEARNAKAK